MRTPLHPQVEWQATLRTLDGTQTREASWSLKQDIRIASDVDLVLLGGNSDKSDLAKDHVGGGIALQKGGGRILGKRESHPFCCLFVLYLWKPFDDGKQQQPSRVLVDITNRIVNDLNGTGHRNRKNCVCGNGGCFFGCFVC